MAERADGDHARRGLRAAVAGDLRGAGRRRSDCGRILLEVSSPGIDRPLTRLKDFEAYAGYEARIELDRLAENRKRFKGVLAGIEGDDVAIDLEGEDETALVPFAWISEAKLVLTDELMKRGAEARKPPAPNRASHERRRGATP